ncbi:hypothetical protein D6777_03385 [Candidatus Woesearchaeota archaeon]|nr:MAG: hypothetical protein D6777_03385 [Candidatus Woesearchaeota archaeon]
MGLFGSNKKEQPAKAELPPLKFPDLPQDQTSEQKQAKITQEEANTIKQAVSMPPVQNVQEDANSEEIMEEKPLFVKVENYREVMSTLEELKEKLKETSTLLNELNRIKDEEEHEIDSWQNELESIKEKLMLIDKTLFE